MTKSSKRFMVMMAAASVAVGCQGGAGGGAALVAVEANDVGITQVEILHRIEAGERLLTIRGLDDQEQEIALATLRTGKVLYAWEPTQGPEIWSDGTELTATLGQDSFTSVTPDREAHEAAIASHSDLSTFVRLHAVAAAITEESGIWFSAPALAPSGEVAFSGSTCQASRFPDPTTVAAALQCCEEAVDHTWHKIGVSGNNFGKVLHRVYDMGPCKTSGGSPVCGNPGSPQGACAYGPCGAKNDTLYGVSGTSTATTAQVFHASSGWCGVDENGTTAGGEIDGGEPFAAQSTYAGVTGTCDAVSCCYQPRAGTSVPWGSSTCKLLDREACSSASECMNNFCSVYGECGDTGMGTYMTNLNNYSGALVPSGNVYVGPMDNVSNERIDFAVSGFLSDWSASGGNGTCVGCYDPMTITSFFDRWGSSNDITITHGPTGHTMTIHLY